MRNYFGAKLQIIIGAFYKPPNDTTVTTGPTIKLGESLTQITSSTRSPYILLGGDFNVSNLSWSEDNDAVPKGRGANPFLKVGGHILFYFSGDEIPYK